MQRESKQYKAGSFTFCRIQAASFTSSQTSNQQSHSLYLVPGLPCLIQGWGPDKFQSAVWPIPPELIDGDATTAKDNYSGMYNEQHMLPHVFLVPTLNFSLKKVAPLI